MLGQGHWHGHEFSVKDHVGDINRWNCGGAAERASIAKRDARENPNGHVAHKESANPGHSTPQVTEKRPIRSSSNKRQKRGSSICAVDLCEEEADDDDDGDGPGGCCGK